jgi:uncharacterized protein YabE (DUF348 family)
VADDHTGLPRGLLTLVLTIAIGLLLAASYGRSSHVVLLTVNGTTWRLRTHQQSVEAFLREAGLEVHPADIVEPDRQSDLTPQVEVIVQKALPLLIEADGQLLEHYTHSSRVAELMDELGLDPRPEDAIILDGERVTGSSALPAHAWMPRRWPLLPGAPLRTELDEPTPWLRLKVQRAVPLSINDSGTETRTYSLAKTVGDALLAHGIILYLGDGVQPSLGTLLTSGMHIEIQRATPVRVRVDGRAVETRVRSSSVAQLLHEAGIQLWGKDYTVPGLEAEIEPNMSVEIVRVLEAWIFESEDLPYDTVWRPATDLELDQYRTDEPGAKGVRKRRVRVVYENGVETQRLVADEWIERQPTTRLMSYGTRIVVRELATPEGTLRYWRKIRMLATSYNAPTAGVSLDHPWYGLTRLGWRARKGIVATDPRVVALRTAVYVPGYGTAVAADTGSAILGRRIDLCYDDDNLVLWKRWVDVYLLEPAPPTEEINWMLPSYPHEWR